MIITKLMGGMGNQLFQYAIGRYLSLKHRTELRIDKEFFNNYKLHCYSLAPFNIIEIYPTEHEIKNIKTYYRERHPAYNKEIEQLPCDTQLEGYWQSEKYFLPIEETIRKEFTIKTPPEGENKELINIMQNCNSVSLHVRRGSYLLPQHYSFHGLCTINYYEACLEYIHTFVKDPQFFIFSDDPLWVYDNIKPKAKTYYISHNKVEADYEDLRLMSICKHNIIANSTFSWWAAWLNTNPNKIILAPQKWVERSDYDTSDLIPSNWIRL